METKQTKSRTSRVLRALTRYAGVLCLVLALFAALGTTQRAHAEGSVDLWKSGNQNITDVDNLVRAHSRLYLETAAASVMGSSQQQRIKLYAVEGETIWIASSHVKYPLDPFKNDGTTTWPQGTAAANRIYDTETGNGSNSNGTMSNAPTTYDNTGEVYQNDVQITLPDGSPMWLDLTSTKGYIANETQETGGPKGVKIPVIDYTTGQATGEYRDGSGYDAVSFTAPQTGVYIVDFKAWGWSTSTRTADSGSGSVNNYYYNGAQRVQFWDVTVSQNIDGVNYAKSGRVWADALLGNSVTGFWGYLYSTTRDGYIWKFGLNGMSPATFTMISNSRGGISTATNASAYHSIQQVFWNSTSWTYFKNLKDKNGYTDGIIFPNPDNTTTGLDAANHMFFNYPDVDALPDSILPSQAAEPGKVTSLRYDGRTADDDTTDHTVPGYVGAGGYFEVTTDGATSYRIIIDMSNMYAKYYHGQSSNSCTEGDAEHNDEICLGDGNFIFHDGEDWYEIRSMKGFTHPRHPNFSSGTAASVIQIVKIDTPDGWTTDGEDFGEYKCLGTIMLGNACEDGIDRILWNGRDEYGRILPAGEYFGQVTDTDGKSHQLGRVYAQAKGGEIHFPLGDMEYMENGASILLMNPPDSVKNDGYEALSKLYYNNEDKSILRDFTVTNMPNSSGSASARGNNAWYWNLPKNMSKSASGEKVDNADKRDGTWMATGAVFENASIAGASSYNSDGTLKSGSAAAAYFSSNGPDYGYVDVWAHVISTEDPTYLEESITLYHVSGQKIVTGFVFEDQATGKQGADNGSTGVTMGEGFYFKQENDKELQGAFVEAFYGDVTGNLDSAKPFYTTKTNSNGYYSIPVDTSKGNITIRVTYNDSYVENGQNKVITATTYKVTTALSGNNQRIVDNPNVSVQVVSLASNTDLIHAENVGYVNKPTTKALRIKNIWHPGDEFKDASLSAQFIVTGKLNDGTIVYQSDVITVEEAMGGIVDLDTLPTQTYMLNTNAGKNSFGWISTATDTTTVQKDQDITYEVKQVTDVTAVTATSAYGSEGYEFPDNAKRTEFHSLDYTPAGLTKSFDYWEFVNLIETSTFAEQVFFDANNNGEYNNGELFLSDNDVTVHMVKLETGVELDSFLYLPDYKDVNNTGDPKYFTKDDVVPYDSETKTFHLAGLLPGEYRVTVEPKEGSPYTFVTYTNGEADNVTGSSSGAVATQTITIGSGTKDEVMVGYYTGMSSLSIRKNVRNSSGDDSVDSYIQNEAFKFTVSLGKKPVGTEVDSSAADLPNGVKAGDIAVTADVFATSTSGVESHSGTQTLYFRETGNTWTTVVPVSLKTGQRIVISNLEGATYYKITELGDDDMPTGYKLESDLVGNLQDREGTTPNTAQNILVSYTNVYKPLPATVYGADGSSVTDNDEVLSLNSATVELVGKNGAAVPTDIAGEFELVLEPGSKKDGGAAPAVEGADATDWTAQASDAVNGATVEFDDGTYITFTEPGTYTYTLREKTPWTDSGIDAIPGVSYATEEYTLTIEVEHVYGYLKIKSANWDESELVFTNTYNPYELTMPIEGTKVLESSVDDVTIANFNGEFEFTLKKGGVWTRDVEAKTADFTSREQPMPSIVVKNNVGGTVAFGDVEFTVAHAGEDVNHAYVYKYTVTESKGSSGGITYDTEDKDLYIRVYKAKVTNSSGQQVETVVAEWCDELGRSNGEATGFTFTNQYDATSGSVSLGTATGSTTGLGLTVEKEMTGRSLKDGDEFTFVIEPQNGAPDIADNTLTLTASDNWTGSFAGTVKFTNVGEYTYTVREVPGTITGVSYDGTVYYVTVKVEDNLTGTLTAKIDSITTADGTPVTGTTMTFTNVYSPESAQVVPIGEKKLTSNDPNVTLADFAGQFTFTLEAVTEGAPMPAVTSVNNNGSVIAFAPISFSADDAGKTYVYKVTETSTSSLVAAADAQYFKVTVTAADDDDVVTAVATPCDKDGNALSAGTSLFTFENTYTAKPTGSVSLDCLKDADGKPLTAKKMLEVLNGSTLEEGTFTMLVEAMNGAPLNGSSADATIKNASERTTEPFKLSKITMTFTEAGTYQYVLRESVGDIDGMSYDTTTRYLVTIEVSSKDSSDNVTGQLTATLKSIQQSKDGKNYDVYSGDITFTNEYGKMYTVDFDGNEQDGDRVTHVPAAVTDLAGTKITLPQAPIYTAADGRNVVFVGWSMEQTSILTKENSESDVPKDLCEAGGTYTITGDVTLYAVWAEDENGNGKPDYTEEYTVTYELGYNTENEPPEGETVKYGGTHTAAAAPTRDGYQFAGWSGSDGKTYLANAKITVTADLTLTAKWIVIGGGGGGGGGTTTPVEPEPEKPDTGISEWLNTVDHIRYMQGVGNSLFQPEGNLTRAQAAQIFYNLLLDKDVAITADFSDVADNAWYAEAVNTLASLGILEGVGGGKYEPERAVTRAEFVTIIMRFAKMNEGGENIFSDVKIGDWFYSYVVRSIQYGWVNGYPDGTFRPNNSISRAEAATIMNRVLGREADEAYVDARYDNAQLFSDVPKSYWAYYQIMEAAVPHDHETNDGQETWIGLK